MIPVRACLAKKVLDKPRRLGVRITLTVAQLLAAQLFEIRVR